MKCLQEKYTNTGDNFNGDNISEPNRMQALIYVFYTRTRTTKLVILLAFAGRFELVATTIHREKVIVG